MSKWKNYSSLCGPSTIRLLICFQVFLLLMLEFLLNSGGQSSLADYCAYFVAYSDGSCIDTNSARAPDRMLGETRGADSRYVLSPMWKPFLLSLKAWHSSLSGLT